MYAAPYGSHTVTISSGTALSGEAHLADKVLVAIVMPDTWDAADITLEGSEDGDTYQDVYDSGGTEYTVSAAASRYIVLDPDDLTGLRYVKVRSGTSATPVNQTAARDIVLVTRHIG